MQHHRYERFSLALVGLAALLLSPNAGAVTSTHTSGQGDFLAFTGAIQINENYPASGGLTALESGQLLLTTPGGSSLSFADHTGILPGNEFIVAGPDHFDVVLEFPVKSMAFELVNPAAGASYDISLRRDGALVASASVDSDDLGSNFFGIWSDLSFDQLVWRESVSAGTELIVGTVFAGSTPNTDVASNDGALICQLPVFTAYTLTYFAGLIPNGFDQAFQFLAYSANLGLKYCKPVAFAPSDIIVDPEPGACEARFEQERIHSTQSNTLGIPFGFEGDWGELGTPSGVHLNTDLEIYARLGNELPEVDALTLASLLSEDITGTGAYAGCDEDTATSDAGYHCPFMQGREIGFPVGRNQLDYRFDVNVGVLDVVYVYVPGFPQGTKNKALKDFALNLLVEVLSFAASNELLGSWRFGNFVDRRQLVVVRDHVPPTISKRAGDWNGDGVSNAADLAFIDEVVIEADEVGGVSTRRYQDFLRGMFDVADSCDRSVSFRPIYPSEDKRSFWAVDTDTQDNSFLVTWQARDPGPNADGLRNEAAFIQRVRVVDTLPPIIQPPPDIVEVTAQSSVTLDLGQPLVFDLADLRPTITNDANFPLAPGLHTVTWTATDAAGNSASTSQTVNIKNSNVEPAAIAQIGGNRNEAISFEPVQITLTGSDPDGDPLSFYIEDYPENGFFIAPLYPYFIEDYRMQSTISNEEIEAVCQANGANQPFFQVEDPLQVGYFGVLDDGLAVVRDCGWIRCRTDTSSPHKKQSRIGLFDSAGTLVNDVRLGDCDFPDDFAVDSRSEMIYSTRGAISQSQVQVRDARSLEVLGAYNLFSLPNPGFIHPVTGGSDVNIENAHSAVVDTVGVLYVADDRADLYAMKAETPTDPSTFIRPEAIGVLFYNPQGTSTSSGADLAIDADNNVYAGIGGRVYKFGPATKNPDGSFTLGELIGWLGRCDIDLAPGDQAVCDVNNHRSLGFSCTDEICAVDSAFNASERTECPNDNGGLNLNTTWGCRPGQFKSTQGIALDPDGTLYVADTGNSRVQRFTPDGFFAGQAESACDGNCFVLGDFGKPRDVAVNSDHFYILDPDRNLVHVSQTSPFLEIGDDYAVLEYSSVNDFACLNPDDCIDQFQFSVSDGVRHPDTGLPIRSAAAPVEVRVSRNFRAPFATPGITATVLEDTPTPITLDGADLDPLDVLTFSIEVPPAHGQVQIAGNQATYTPDPDYVGEDSFSFRADDGLEISDPALVQIMVTDVNDPPVILAEVNQVVGQGFEIPIEVPFTEPDAVDKHRLLIRWNDGSGDETEGELLMDGTATGPLLFETFKGNGTIRASHVFASTGTFDVEYCLTDRVILDESDNKLDTPESIQQCAITSVLVEPQVDLRLSLDAPAALAIGGSGQAVVTLDNVAPASGPGVTATGVVLVARLDPRLTTGLPPGCSRLAEEIQCTLADIVPGGSRSVSFALIATSDPGFLGSVTVSEFDILLAQTDATESNLAGYRATLLPQADFLIGGLGDELVDEPDVSPGDGACQSASGVCTLRAAVMEANALPGPQTVALGPGLFQLDDAAGGDLDVEGELTVVGTGPGQTYLHAGDAGRIFDLCCTAGSGLTLDGLTLTGGTVGGGAIFLNDLDPPQRLTLRNVHLTGNNAPGLGGAILALGSPIIEIENSVFSHNSAGNGGGAVAIEGSSQWTNVTVSGNSVTAPVQGGGGILFGASREGGGQHVLTNVTVTGNSADVGGGIVMDTFFYTLGANGQVELINTVLADNEAASGANCSVSGGSLVSLGHNLLGDLAGCGLTALGSDVAAGRAELFALSSNDSELLTHRPRLAGAAIDGGDPTACPAVDQRGKARPEDGDGDADPVCDIGAHELQNVVLFSSSFE